MSGRRNPSRERLVEDIRQIPDTKQRDDVLEDLKCCIRQPNPAPLGVFNLDLNGFRFDREEANER